MAQTSVPKMITQPLLFLSLSRRAEMQFPVHRVLLSMALLSVSLSLTAAAPAPQQQALSEIESFQDASEAELNPLNGEVNTTYIPESRKSHSPERDGVLRAPGSETERESGEGEGERALIVFWRESEFCARCCIVVVQADNLGLSGLAAQLSQRQRQSSVLAVH